MIYDNPRALLVSDRKPKCVCIGIHFVHDCGVVRVHIECYDEEQFYASGMSSIVYII